MGTLENLKAEANTMSAGDLLDQLLALEKIVASDMDGFPSQTKERFREALRFFREKVTQKMETENPLRNKFNLNALNELIERVKELATCEEVPLHYRLETDAQYLEILALLEHKNLATC